MSEVGQRGRGASDSFQRLVSGPARHLSADGPEASEDSVMPPGVRLFDVSDPSSPREWPHQPDTSYVGRHREPGATAEEDEDAAADDGDLRFEGGLDGGSEAVPTVYPVDPSSSSPVQLAESEGPAGLEPAGSAVAPVVSNQALTVVDSERVRDSLGREILAAHLDGLLAGICADDDRRRAVIHLDGRWGGGKSSLLELLLDPALAGLHTPPPRNLIDPVVVRYNAWRESAVAPEWWSLASSVHTAVRRERAFPTRFLMSIWDVLGRLLRARAVLVGFAALAIVLLARQYAILVDFKILQDALSLLTAVAVLGLAAGRVLFWASPAFGRFHLRSDDNPLGEISAAVARLRRWLPRDTGRQRVADSALALWIATVTLWLAVRTRADNTAHSHATAILNWYSGHLVPVLASLLAATVVGSLMPWGQPDSAPPVPPAAPTPQHPIESTSIVGGGSRGSDRTRRLMPAGGAVLGVAVLAFMAFSIASPRPVDQLLSSHAVEIATLLWILGIFSYVAWVNSTLRRPRRPLLVVIDDLDRCSSSRVVKLLETIHTLMREPAIPSRCQRWRMPAPLIFLVLADGRWVRQSFEQEFTAFSPLGGPTHSLGADFVQKVFDHTVIVPSLSASQVGRYIATITRDERTERAAGVLGAFDLDADRPGRQAEDLARRLVSEGDPATLNTLAVDAALDDVHDPLAWIEIASLRASRATDDSAIAAVKHHLLTLYVDLMPSNPRLVKRVANAYGMLRAIKDHVGHDQSDDVMVRAAILLIRFPTLVDELTVSPEPPNTDPASASTDSPWRRRDVQQVIGGCTAENLASCYGRAYAPAVPEPAQRKVTLPEAADAQTPTVQPASETEP